MTLYIEQLIAFIILTVLLLPVVYVWGEARK